jgi:tRNA(fMet)-specific endonuclease VapC
MTLLDTDSLSLLMHGHASIVQRVGLADVVAITLVTRIEILQGRFASILKAAHGEQLLQAQQRLLENEAVMDTLEVVPFDAAAGTEFDRLRRVKGLKNIGRADLLIASIALANRAILVTRNMKHFRQVPRLLIEDWTR